MNVDFHAKWFFKYKVDPKLRNSFYRLVQENYGEMIPKMSASLKSRGYDMSDITFMQFRNASSGGSSSMDLDLTTSMHPEAFSTPDLLNKDVDFSQLAPEDVASIGKVLDVKVTSIEKNPLLSNTSKMQAKCREASKEIDNMLLKKLNQDLAKAKPGSREYLQTQVVNDLTREYGFNK